LAGRLDEACEVLERAMDMNPADELARENLKRCQERMANRSNSEKTRKRRRPVRPPSD
jgi:Flp pilus assembly protein TadD